MSINQEEIKYDVVIVGAGPAGLSAAIELKNLSINNRINLSICIIEKGSEVGAHVLSGAILDTNAIDSLIPNWANEKVPIESIVTNDQFFFLTANRAFKINNYLIPKPLKNNNCYIIKLGNFTRWMAQYAENLGIDIFSGFAATDIIYSENKKVIGVKIEEPINKNQIRNINLIADYTILSEGSRGSLGKKIIKKFNLDKDCDPQSYSIGLKEVWEISDVKSNLGNVIHTFGWPLNDKAYGGSFLYHMKNNQLSIGTIVGLDYKNPWISPFEEFQQFKTHPFIHRILKNGKRISYGAKSITTGGLLSLPKFIFDGGIIIGCNAGFLNPAKLKGIYSAIKSGQLAANYILKKFDKNIQINNDLYEFEHSNLYKDLKRARNFKNWFQKGNKIASVMNFLEQNLLNGYIPWNIHKKIPDNLCMQDKDKFKKINYPLHDNQITFDRKSSIYLSNIKHNDNQISHIKLFNLKYTSKINNEKYGQPETRYCPAEVYKYIENSHKEMEIKISPQNCIHCKTCDIKDPMQNIEWSPPLGGDGPIYKDM